MPNWCTCELTVEGPEAEVARLVSAAKGCKPRYMTGGKPDEPGPVEEFSFNALCPVPDEVLEQGYQAAGHDWEVANWGTEWGAVDSLLDERSDGVAIYWFDTAWEPPVRFLGEVAADWPDLTFTLEYETRGVRERGTARWEGGILSSHVEEADFGFELEEDDENEGIFGTSAG